MDAWPRSAMNPTARPSHIPQQKLNDCGGADVLHADGVLRPADGITKRGSPLAPGIVAQRLGDLQKQTLRNAAGLLHHLRRVARIVAFQDLKHAPRVLQRGIGVLGGTDASAIASLAGRGFTVSRGRLRFTPSYIQVFMSYLPLPFSQPLKSPSLSSVSLNSSLMIAAALV